MTGNGLVKILMLVFLVLVLASTVAAYDAEDVEDGASSRRPTASEWLSEGHDSPTENAYRNQFMPLTTKGWFGLVFMVVVLSIATLGGVGGNVVILPVCLILFEFNPHVAVAHTSLFSAVSSLTRILFERVEQARGGEKAKANYHLSLLAAPPAILGSFIGVNLNTVSPDSVLLGITLTLQAFLLIYTFNKYVQKRKAELKVNDKTDYVSVTSDNLNLSEGSPALSTKNPSLSLKKEQEESGSFAKETTNQKELIPKDFLLILLLLGMNPLFVLIRGNSVTKSLIDNVICSKTDLAIVVGYLILLVVMIIMFRSMILKRNEGKEVGDGDVAITGRYASIVMITILGVSILGGWVSSGSSTVITVCMIAFGLSPFLASSTSLVVATIFSGSSAAMYWMNGYIYNSCAIIAGSVVISATLLTRMTIYQYFLKHGRASIILLFISIMMIITIPLNVYQVGPHIYQDYKNGTPIFQFKGFCPKQTT